MLFNSLEFFIFLPVVFLLYWYVFRTFRWQNLFVVCASYVFYGWWNETFLLLIAFTSICSFLSGIGISRLLDKGLGRRARWLCILNITINLLILGVYKYYNFFVSSLVDAFSLLGITLHHSSLNLVLPVGISFYTFQAISYTVDVYRRRVVATNDIVSFFAFISFFPQLVAGPIERAASLLPQFQKSRTFSYRYAVDGCRQMLWGFFKKIVIADNCARYADIAFNNVDGCGSISLILGALFFTFQIYGDFSGYSSIAIGTAKLFGISLRDNFRTPYFSRDIAEFWRRWHISLNKWFVDYVYIPLGGSRVSKSKVIRNVFVIFLLSGLWHGANWTFVCWGGYHACLFLPLMLTGANNRKDMKYPDRFLPSFIEIIKIIVTFAFVVIGWIIFRADDINSFYDYMVGIFSFRGNISAFVSLKYTLWLQAAIAIMLLVEWINRNSFFEFQILPQNILLRNVFYIILIISCYLSYMMMVEDNNTFIYFQF